MFNKALKSQAKLRLGLFGPSGSGKTYTALQIASGLGKKIALIDTEYASASMYANIVPFDNCILTSFSPLKYIEAIQFAGKAGYDVVIIDSLSHAWSGKDGALEQVDNAARRSKSQNTYFAWRDVTPLHNAMIDAIKSCPCHVIVTMRSKTEYVIDSAGGKSTPRKIGLAPIQREGMEYEFDLCGELDGEHFLNVSKTRFPELDGKSIAKPGRPLGEMLSAWLQEGVLAIASPVVVSSGQEADYEQRLASAASVEALAGVGADIKADVSLSRERIAELRSAYDERKRALRPNSSPLEAALSTSAKPQAAAEYMTWDAFRLRAEVSAVLNTLNAEQKAAVLAKSSFGDITRIEIANSMSLRSLFEACLGVKAMKPNKETQ